jgi:hypothetical protein
VVGASPSNCSYHLRELARFGLVERVDDPLPSPASPLSPDGRDRPWRPTATGFRYGREEGEPSTEIERVVNRRLIHAGINHDAALAHGAVDAHDRQPADWRAAETLSTFGLAVTAAELTELTSAVDAILRPFIGLTRTDTPPDARPVHIVFNAFLRPVAAADAPTGPDAR